MHVRRAGIVRWGLLSMWLVASSLGGSLPTIAQESANFVMDRVTFSSASLEASSTNYAITLTLGQEGPVGSVSVCNAGAFQRSGFWSVLGGETAVPIVLTVGRDSLDPSAVELSWSGSVQLFEVFSSDVAAAASNPGSSLTVTALCGLTDMPPPEEVIFYLVLPAGD